MKNVFYCVAVMILGLNFAAGAQDSLEALSYMKGKWTVTSSFHEDGKWADPTAPMRATADTVLGGSFIRVHAPVSFPGSTFQFEMTLSYDRFHGVYRAMFLDDLNGYMDVYLGTSEGEVLSLNNAETGTSFPDGEGGVVIGKLDIEKSADGFVVTSFIATEKTGPYNPFMRLKFIEAQ